MKKDPRGFRIFTEFKDTYGAEVVIKMSSAVVKRGWIFVQGGGTGENKGAIHFDNAQAKRMIIALQAFLKES